MKLVQTVQLKQTLKLKQYLSPKLIQMLKLFNYSYTDLVEKVRDEVENNVLLEVSRFDQLTSYASKSLHQNDASFMGKDVSDFLKDTKEEGSLYHFLDSQLKLENISEKDHAIASALIEEINPRGYLDNYAQLKPMLCQRFGISERKLLEVLGIIQTFEPEGVGARSLKECLLIQLDAHQFDDVRLRDIMKKIVSSHLDDLNADNYAKIAKELSIEAEGVKAVHEFIKQNLTPNPASNFSNTAFNMHIIPSFETRVENGKVIVINLEKTKGIEVTISSHYLKLLESKTLDADTRQFLTEKLEKAKELIETIQNRQATLNNLARFILEKQRTFLEKGLFYLEPLLQKEVAEHLSLSSSTVSRIVSSKYVQTPYGVISFKQLCPRRHFGKTAIRVQHIVKELADTYPTHSDQQLVALLKESGLDIARRTVAKYRHLAGVESSYSRPTKSSGH